MEAEAEADELQGLLEEAWNAEGVQGSADEVRAFWEGMLERQVPGEVRGVTRTETHASLVQIKCNLKCHISVVVTCLMC